MHFIARTGADFFGEAARRELSAAGVNLDLVARDEAGATGIAIINVGEGGENCISVVGGVNLVLDRGDVERGRRALEGAKVLLLQLEVPLEASLAAARIARSPGMCWPAISKTRTSSGLVSKGVFLAFEGTDK